MLRLPVAASEMEHESCDIAFNDLRFTIQSGKETLRLLQGVSGACRSGRLTAILGPSGSSKTTLVWHYTEAFRHVYEDLVCIKISFWQ